MNDRKGNDPQLEEVLRQSYGELRELDPARRAAVLMDLAQVVPAGRSSRGRMPALRWGWVSAAACLVLAIGVWSLRGTSSDGMAYAIDGVPGRMAAVQSIALRGWQWERDQSGPNKPPLRIPIEIVVKRPSMFRHTITGVSFNKGRAVVRRMLHLCDGKHEWYLDEAGKPVISRPVSPLDARLKTELLAQVTAVLAVLGPPAAPYRHLTQERLDGRLCDVYEAEFPLDMHATLARVWIETATGLPLRVIRDEVGADHKLYGETALTEVSINAPLTDDLFRFPAAGVKDSNTDAAPAGADPLRLDSTATSSASVGGSTLEVWNVLQIGDNAALVVWRRSSPAVRVDGIRDPLAGMTIRLTGTSDKRSVRHAWLHQSKSADKWNWSLVVPEDGKAIGRDAIGLTMQGKHGSASAELIALRFNDEDLQQLLIAARRSTLEDHAKELPLDALRAQARTLLNSNSTK